MAVPDEALMARQAAWPFVRRPSLARARAVYPTLTIDNDTQTITLLDDGRLSSGGITVNRRDRPTIRCRVPVSEELAYTSQERIELACQRCDRLGIWPVTRFVHRVVKRYDTNAWMVENVIVIAAFLTKARFLYSCARFWRWTGKDMRAWEGTYLTWRAILPPPALQATSLPDTRPVRPGGREVFEVSSLYVARSRTR